LTKPTFITPARHRKLVQTFRTLHGQQHRKEFDLACLMSDVLAIFEKATPRTADAAFCEYVGKAFNPSGSPHRNLPGGTRKKFLLMGKEARRFQKAHRKNPAQVWNDLGGWLSVTILNGLKVKDREKFERKLLKEIKARGVGITVSTVRTMLAREGLRPGKPGRPREADGIAKAAKVRAEFVSLVRGLQLAGLKARNRRTRADTTLLKGDPDKMVDRLLKSA
jgi:hypothetical protein